MPEPEIIEHDGGILATLLKDRYNEAGLKKMGLNDRQLKAVLHVVGNGKVTNKECQ
jgi:ATP-dependent DNA helicase RecG